MIMDRPLLHVSTCQPWPSTSGRIGAHPMHSPCHIRTAYKPAAKSATSQWSRTVEHTRSGTQFLRRAARCHAAAPGEHAHPEDAHAHAHVHAEGQPHAGNSADTPSTPQEAQHQPQAPTPDSLNEQSPQPLAASVPPTTWSVPSESTGNSTGTAFSQAGLSAPQPDQPGMTLNDLGLGSGDAAAALAARMARIRALDEYKALLVAAGIAPDPDALALDASSDMGEAAKALRRQQKLQLAADASTQSIDLFKCALLIAKHAYPQLDEAVCYGQLDSIVERAEALLEGQPRYPLKVVRAINTVLYDQLGFKGNADAYYEADNSCINRVLERKTGIPITLSLVYMEVGRRLGLTLVGCNFPGHFMLRLAGNEMQLFIDAFQGGEVCYLEDAEARLGGALGAQVKLDPRWLEPGSAIDPATFLMRMLNNLKHAYLMTNQVEAALSILRYMRATDPSRHSDLRDEGLCLYALKRWAECTEAVEQYLEVVGEESDVRERDLLEMLLLRVRGIMREGPGADPWTA